MADKYASQQQPNREEWAANIMQARMSWPDAERYAAEFARRGVLESGDQFMAVAVLTEHMTRNRATAIVKDLIDYGAMEDRR
jgi:hypothetical protein